MFDVFSKFEAIITEDDILAVTTFINSFIGINFPKFAAITIIVVLLTAYFFRNQLFFNFVFLLLDFSHDFRRFLIPTKRTLHHPIIFELMLGPLGKTVKMEGVSTNSSARSSGIAPYYLHVANRTKIVLLLILILLNNDISFWNFHFNVLEEVRNFVLMDAPIGNYVSQLFIIVVVFEKKKVVIGNVKNLSKDIEGVKAMLVIVHIAGTFELVTDSDLEFGTIDILKDKTCPACYPDHVKLLHVG